MTGADDTFEERLRALAEEADPPPTWVLESARAAFTTRDLDAELAELVADSWAEDAVLTRDAGSELRLLSFEAGEVVVEVDVEPHAGGSGVRLHGLATGVVGDLTVRHSGGTTTVPLGPDGRFDVTAVPAGPVRLEATTPSGGRVATAWVTA